MEPLKPEPIPLHPFLRKSNYLAYSIQVSYLLTFEFHTQNPQPLHQNPNPQLPLRASTLNPPLNLNPKA